MSVLRTPDERFENLPKWPYESKYVDDLDGYEGLRMAYVDEGHAGAEQTYLCLHGEPTWSYLYRKMIPVFRRTDARVVAPDFFGFGKSDKPEDDATYTYHFHRNSLLRLVERLDLYHVTLVVQDWGGILGLTLPMEMRERFDRILIMNTALPDGETELGEGFESWRQYVAEHPDLDVGRLMQRAVPGISDAEAGAYDAPFPDRRYKAGVRRFPELVPRTPDMDGAEESRRAAAQLNGDFVGPIFMAIGAQDPVLGPPVMHRLRAAIPNCPAPMEIREAGHFVPEHGERVAVEALRYFSNQP
jgi:pimeloyl-ACP methyl ester carboxylesterase